MSKKSESQTTPSKRNESLYKQTLPTNIISRISNLSSEGFGKQIQSIKDFLRQLDAELAGNNLLNKVRSDFLKDNLKQLRTSQLKLEEKLTSYQKFHRRFTCLNNYGGSRYK
jgi:hypothetical protein